MSLQVYTHLQVGENVTIESQASPNVIPRKQVQYLVSMNCTTDFIQLLVSLGCEFIV